MLYIATYSSPLGEILLASDDTALTGIWFAGQKHFGRGLCAEPVRLETAPIVAAKAWLDQYFSGSVPEITVPIRFMGTDFQKTVWSALLQIPYGETETYGTLAKQLGIHSAQAIGGAVGRNPISVLVPCHRVVGAGGALTGYAGGMDRKRWMLSWESTCKMT